ncbi:MAG: glycosyl hydrolase [bacterium]
MTLSFLEEFAKPGSQYRGKPFWAWNGKLEPEELRRQIRVMHQMGLGGFFMHSRVGLDTAYLSDEWFECINACIDEAKKLNMEAWLYDEDRWPSGAAGALVTKNPKFRMRHLSMYKYDSAAEFNWEGQVMGVFTARIDGSNATDVKAVSHGAHITLPAGYSVVKFVVEIDDTSAWFNNGTYLDTMNHEAVQEFIKITHQKYTEKCKKFLGNVVPGIFTDEPNYGHQNENSHPWTEKLPKIFKKRYHYDLLPHLMELFYDVDNATISKVRYNFLDCTTFLFVDAFARQIFEWAEKNNMKFTGHVLEEDTLSSQTHVVGDAMRFYEYMQAPGMDLLTEHWRIYNVAKQVSSAAHQFGAKWRLTETYGCTGWDFPFLGHKALGDWQAALGINLRCQHLAYYTMKGQAKRDYPASISYQSPWCRYYAKVEDYFARIGAVTTRGQEVRDILVIHPVESMWTKVKVGWHSDPGKDKLNNQFIALTDTLYSNQLDFDFGNEEIISRHAKIKKTREGTTLIIGKAVYKVVVLPPMITIRHSTFELLKKFSKAGGKVIFAGDAAGAIDAVITHEVQDFAAKCVKTSHVGEELSGALESYRRVSVNTSELITSALYMLREDEEAEYLFVVNTGHDLTPGIIENIMSEAMARDRKLGYDEVTITAFAGCAGQPLLMNAETGETALADATKKGDQWVVRTPLPALGSIMLICPKKATAIDAVQLKKLAVVKEDVIDNKSWHFRLDESNVLVLDKAKYRINGCEWHSELEVLKLDRAVRDALGIQHRGGSMVQPWARVKNKSPKSLELELSYEFDADYLPSGDIFFAVENPQNYQITLNGSQVSADADCGWWADKSLRRLPINGAVLKKGKNELLLKSIYDENNSGLEIAYLLGNFGVKVTGATAELTAPPKSLKLGDCVPQGLAFYSGSISYTEEINIALAKGERLYVNIPEYAGVGVRILVDGIEAGVIGWQPNEIEITALVKGKSTADLTIELLGHRRNSHGPFHLNEKWPSWTGPEQYQVGDDRWQNEYQLVPFGLMESPKLVIKK